MTQGVPPARVGLMLTVVGAAVAAAGVWAMVAAAGIEFRYTLIGALVLVVLIGAIASNTPVDVVIVAVVVALVWSVIPSGEDPTATVQPEPGDRTLVALGDSYMSGEGAPAVLRRDQPQGPQRMPPGAHRIRTGRDRQWP